MERKEFLLYIAKWRSLLLRCQDWMLDDNRPLLCSPNLYIISSTCSATAVKKCGFCWGYKCARHPEVIVRLPHTQPPPCPHWKAEQHLYFRRSSRRDAEPQQRQPGDGCDNTRYCSAWHHHTPGTPKGRRWRVPSSSPGPSHSRGPTAGRWQRPRQDPPGDAAQHGPPSSPQPRRNSPLGSPRGRRARGRRSRRILRSGRGGGARALRLRFGSAAGGPARRPHIGPHVEAGPAEHGAGGSPARSASGARGPVTPQAQHLTACHPLARRSTSSARGRRKRRGEGAPPTSGEVGAVGAEPVRGNQGERTRLRSRPQ